MSDEEIDKAVKEAAQFEAADKKKKEGVELRNDADSMIFQTEKALAEVGDKLDAADKETVEADIKALKDLVEKVKDNDELTAEQMDEIKAAKDKLVESSQKVFEKLYADAQAQANQAEGASTADNGNNNDGKNPYGDDVVDGDYKEV